MQSNIIPAYNLPASNLHNPSISQDQSIKGSLGYLTVALITGAISPVIGLIAAPIQAIKGIWNICQLKIASDQKKIAKNEYKIAKEEVLKYTNEMMNECITNKDLAGALAAGQKKLAAEKTIQEFPLKISQLRESKTDLKTDIAQNKQKFIAAVMALIPFLGIFAAGAYLKANSPDVKDTGLRGGAEAIAQAMTGGQEEVIQSLIYPLSGTSYQEWIDAPEYQQLFLKNEAIYASLNAKSTEIPVNRGDREGVLSALAIPNEKNKTFDPNEPTMVVFHGNGQTKEVMAQYARLYQEKGFNVMVLTMGGYPGSDEGVETSEITAYQDANAAIEYLKKKGFNNIGVHGTSIGGTLAFAAAELHPDVVKMVVADQTIGRARDVAANLVRNLSDGILPAAIIRGAVGGGFSSGKVVPGVVGPDGKPYVTDGLDNVRKTKVLSEQAKNGKGNCQVFAIKADHDNLMGRIGNEDEGFKEDFADDLIMARYGTLDEPGHRAVLSGGHCTWYGYGEKNHVSEATALSNSLKEVFS